MRLLGYSIPRQEGETIQDSPPRLTRADLLAWTDAQRNTYVTSMVYEHYDIIEYAIGMECKDTQLEEATDIVIKAFTQAVEMYRLGAGGDKVPLIWRIKPDMDSWFGVVTEYREDGPDIDHVTDKRCVIDRSIGYVKVRARFLADTMPTGTIVARTMNDGVPPGWKALVQTERDIRDNVVMAQKL